MVSMSLVLRWSWYMASNDLTRFKVAIVFSWAPLTGPLQVTQTRGSSAKTMTGLLLTGSP